MTAHNAAGHQGEAALSLISVSKMVTLPDSSSLSILQAVSLRVEPRQIVSIMGKSGSGKSTLLSVMGLLSSPTRGSVVLDGVDAGALSDARRARLRNHTLGFIFQNYSLVPTWTVLQNCQLPLLYRKDLRRKRSKAMATDQLVRLGLGDRLDAYPRHLSGGEQQRVAIARALVRAPNVILADEPTGALDESTAASVLDILLEAVSGADCSLVLVTHDKDVASCADVKFSLSSGNLTTGCAGDVL